MIITCPSCKTKYTVPASSFAAGSRAVKCTKCKNTWHQGPAETFSPEGTQFDNTNNQEQVVQEQTSTALETPQDSAQKTSQGQTFKERQTGKETIPPFSPQDTPALSSLEPPQNLWPGVTIGIAATIAFIGAIFLFKGPILNAFPNIKTVFSSNTYKLTTQDDLKTLGIVIDNVERDILEDDGFTTYAIQGIVTNTNLTPTDSPNLAVSLLDEHGNILDSWRAEPQKRTLQPGESTSWVCYFYNPPLAKISEYKVGLTPIN